MNNRLQKIWKAQRQYNLKVIAEEGTGDQHYWMKQYLLGMVSEINECLDDLQWKRHRAKQGQTIDVDNLTYELADMFKYLVSMCQILNVSEDSLLTAVEAKTEMLRQSWDQEFLPIPSSRPILITDIDGTLGDWRTAFIRWCNNKGVPTTSLDPNTSLEIDVDLSIRYPDYFNLKEEFERTGGYANVIPYSDAVIAMQQIQTELDAFVIAVTARPNHRYHRIWFDTWTWLQHSNFKVDQLHMSSEFRILMASSLFSKQKVILWEDNPALIMRAATSGIQVFARRHNYNEQLSHPNLTFVEKYTDILPQNYFKERRPTDD